MRTFAIFSDTALIKRRVLIRVASVMVVYILCVYPDGATFLSCGKIVSPPLD